jgi:hypothetical protein
VGRDAAESAFGAGDDFVGAEAFKDFGELIEIAADDDVRFFVAIAGALGDEKCCLDVVGSDDDELGAVDACIGEGAFLLGVVHDNGFAIANEVIDSGGVLINQNVRLLGAAEMLDDANAKVRVTDNDNVVLHFFGEHAATFLRIVSLQRLQHEDGNDDAEKDALSPEGVESPEGIGAIAKIDGVEKGFAEGEMIPEVKGEHAESEPKGNENETPAALAQEDSQADPEEAAHESQRSRDETKRDGRLVGTRTPDLHRVKVAL